MAPSASRRLTTHVLDTAAGRPAAGLSVKLWRLVGEERTIVASVQTNADGRCDAPLLADEALQPGTYEILFDVGEYFERNGVASNFLDLVPVRFQVAPASEGPAHLHVPLLISPYGYSTYRGS
ncbi:hydroxyisourate hydrolase [Methylobacterium brachythecii]|uniref:5-hydroxyisourate hydrolase n=1 Tax=Methylobacterium brachythecii TaxID=1176177 RepID=A0A7W6AK73_9HYPH|nr:hydroxyisourate hydrolase [Methylobacterium brachythecii]MBB3904001.1 5-hydroxyisourate hydrolase [Methylobacterium brachythecii]GLS42742.1 5-hydroxyisourate hydrolase [Methylobacterium brachythecii]